MFETCLPNNGDLNSEIAQQLSAGLVTARIPVMAVTRSESQLLTLILVQNKQKSYDFI